MNKTTHQLIDDSGTILVDSMWIEEELPKCINHDNCGGEVHPDAGIHQFCESCYRKWASAWFKGSSEEE